MPTRYKDRPAGSTSKLSTIRDGVRILKMIGLLVKEERPLMFFGCVFFALALLSVGLATPVVLEFLRTGLVPRFPTAILSAAIMMVAFLSLVCGLVLDTVTHSGANSSGFTTWRSPRQNGRHRRWHRRCPRVCLCPPAAAWTPAHMRRTSPSDARLSQAPLALS